MQGAGLQWRHLLGNEVLNAGPGSAWMRGFGAGLSNTAQKRLLVCEWATAQAASHCLHPIHRSGWINTVFMQMASFPG
jgi:hypothetical protein